MSYTSKTFNKGDTLTADDMNNIIAGINEAKANSNNTSSGSSDSTSLYEQAKRYLSRFSHQYMRNIEYASDSKVDIVIFAGQSNSCGRATLASATTEKDIFLTVGKDVGFTFQNSANGTCDETIKEITEPISINGSTGYGYIPSFINAYYNVTGRKICACFKSSGGTSIHNWFPYELDSDGNETTTVPAYYTAMKTAVTASKEYLVNNGYEVGDVLLVWCQGENDAAYLGNDTANAYCTEYGTTCQTDEQKIAYYNKGFSRIVEKLKEDVGLCTAFIIRIGHSKGKVLRNEVIIQAQNELCRENPDCVMVSTIFAGALDFIEEDGSTRNLMIDASHYLPEGYLRAGMEAGVNAGIYQNSNKLVKPILLEYNALYKDGTANTPDTTEYERNVDKYLYDPCRIDFNFMKTLVSETSE